MKASVVELRYKMKEILQALRRHENVDILYHGKVAGTIVPPKNSKSKKRMKAQEHSLFGMQRDAYKDKSVDQIMDTLRGGRYRDL